MLLPSRACVLELVRIRCPVRCNESLWRAHALGAGAAIVRRRKRQDSVVAAALVGGHCAARSVGRRRRVHDLAAAERCGRCRCRRSGNIATLWPASCRVPFSRSTPFLWRSSAPRGRRPGNGSGFRAAFEHEEFQESLTEYRNRLPQTFNLAIADRDGNLTVSTAAWPTPAINIADRDYFKEARDRPGDRLVTSIPIKNRIDGSQTIVFARRLERSREGTSSG